MFIEKNNCWFIGTNRKLRNKTKQKQNSVIVTIGNDLRNNSIFPPNFVFSAQFWYYCGSMLSVLTSLVSYKVLPKQSKYWNNWILLELHRANHLTTFTYQTDGPSFVCAAWKATDVSFFMPVHTIIRNSHELLHFISITHITYFHWVLHCFFGSKKYVLKPWRSLFSFFLFRYVKMNVMILYLNSRKRAFLAARLWPQIICNPEEKKPQTKHTANLQLRIICLLSLTDRPLCAAS